MACMCIHKSASNAMLTHVRFIAIQVSFGMRRVDVVDRKGLGGDKFPCLLTSR